MTTYLERAVHSVYRECFRKLPSIYVFSYFPFGFEGRMWDLIVSVPDHCLSFYFVVIMLKHMSLNPFSICHYELIMFIAL